MEYTVFHIIIPAMFICCLLVNNIMRKKIKLVKNRLNKALIIINSGVLTNIDLKDIENELKKALKDLKE